MNDEERWLYLDGPAPASVRPILEALRSAPPATPQDMARVASRFFERLDAVLAQRSAAAGAPRDTPPPETAAPQPAAPMPPVVRPPASIARTAQSLELPAALREPKRALPPPPAMGSALDETTPVGAGVPNLTLQQYASLRAELEVRPHRWSQILPQYRVKHQAAFGALDEHWQRTFAEHPEQRAVFEAFRTECAAWLRTQPA
jgi:hypothetical protein